MPFGACHVFKHDNVQAIKDVEDNNVHAIINHLTARTVIYTAFFFVRNSCRSLETVIKFLLGSCSWNTFKLMKNAANFESS